MKGREVSFVGMFFLMSVVLFFIVIVGYAFPVSALSADHNLRIESHKVRADEIERIKQLVGVYEEGKNYNVIIDGHGTGLRPPTEKGWQRIIEEMQIVDHIARLDQRLGAPPGVDNSTDVWFPPVGNQDGEGSCVCFAVGYYMKTYQEAKEHGWDLSGVNWVGGYYGAPDLYQDRIFSPDFIYHQINGGIDGGSYYSDAMNLVAVMGACSWAEMPYNPLNSTVWPSESAWREAPLYRGETGYGYAWVTTSVDELKNWLADDRLAVISIDANQYSALTSDDMWTLDNYPDPDYADGTNRNHANTVVGYDDNKAYTESGQTRYGAFKIANSWGEGGWEKIADGYYWISYEAMKQRVKYCFLNYDRLGYTPEVISVFEMSHLKRGECDITLGMGDTSSPTQTKRFDDWNLDGGDYPFPSDKMILDITEFSPSWPVNFFLQIYDGGSNTTGTIDHFSVEYYDDYCSGVPIATATSTDPPASTIRRDSVFAETGDVSLPVELSSFTASSEEGVVTLQWATQSEIDNRGFHLYRSLAENGAYERITSELIPGAGSTATWQTYTFTDSTIATGITYWYKLEDVAFDGTRSMHGPIGVTAQAAEQPDVCALSPC
ncbi:MAG: C1 family peptidase, partial [Candidatus Latescibacteria bacterium]|nr:C1 family peptidase [Candidatus Latescibacterota bacterium]